MGLRSTPEGATRQRCGRSSLGTIFTACKTPEPKKRLVFSFGLWEVLHAPQ